VKLREIETAENPRFHRLHSNQYHILSTIGQKLLTVYFTPDFLTTSGIRTESQTGTGRICSSQVLVGQLWPSKHCWASWPLLEDGQSSRCLAIGMSPVCASPSMELLWREWFLNSHLHGSVVRDMFHFEGRESSLAMVRRLYRLERWFPDWIFRTFSSSAETLWFRATEIDD
jgi:hypothetical protein